MIYHHTFPASYIITHLILTLFNSWTQMYSKKFISHAVLAKHSIAVSFLDIILSSHTELYLEWFVNDLTSRQSHLINNYIVIILNSWTRLYSQQFISNMIFANRLMILCFLKIISIVAPYYSSNDWFFMRVQKNTRYQTICFWTISIFEQRSSYNHSFPEWISWQLRLSHFCPSSPSLFEWNSYSNDLFFMWSSCPYSIIAHYVYIPTRVWTKLWLHPFLSDALSHMSHNTEFLRSSL